MIAAAAPAFPSIAVLPGFECRPAYTRLERAKAWLNTPVGGLVLLILGTLMARLLFAGTIGLGIDESYMVAAGRTLRSGYFDHPPLAWWMVWAAAHLAGSDGAFFVRLPFVLLFALTTWLMFRITATLFGARAGLWAAALLNVSPVFGITTGAWVLPDGPLMAALLGAVACLIAALPAQGRAAWGWWLGAGLFAGLAMFSKYTAVLSIAGAIAFLLTQPAARQWLRRPQPYLAGLVALAVFSPVLLWNAEHGWTSLLFQAGRAGGNKMHPFGPLATLGGEALFVLPWIWLPLVVCGLNAVRRGPRDGARWLFACLALPPILLFLIVSLRSHVLFHWAAPGYLMLFPLLGAAISRRQQGRVRTRLWLSATAMFVLLGTAFVATEVRYNWLHYMGENFALGNDPDLDAIDWKALRTDLRADGLLDHPGLIVAATRWHDAGKIDYALGGHAAVICFGADPREYGLIAKQQDHIGDDVVIVAPRLTLAQVSKRYGPLFDTITSMPETLVRHAGRPAMLLPMFLGHRLHQAARTPTS